MKVFHRFFPNVVSVSVDNSYPLDYYSKLFRQRRAHAYLWLPIYSTRMVCGLKSKTEVNFIESSKLLISVGDDASELEEVVQVLTGFFMEHRDLPIAVQEAFYRLTT